MSGHSSIRRALAPGGILLLISLIARPVIAGAAPRLPAAPAGSLERISAGSSGSGGGTYAAISASGRYVAFESSAGGLLPGKLNDSNDVYLHDQQTGQMELVSTRSGGMPVYNPGDYTSPPAVSADGRYIAFMSRAENLAPNDTNNMPDVFLHDRLTDQTELVSVALNGTSGNDGSYTPAISANGRFVAFQSFASNLINGDTNNMMDVFIRDMQTGMTERVSVANSGAQGTDHHDYGFPGLSVSDDSRYVAFAYQYLPVAGSSQTGPNVYLRDRQATTIRWVAQGTLPAISGDGRFLAFAASAGSIPGSSSVGQDMYLFDQQNNHLERISVPSRAAETPGATIECPPSLSANGQIIAFETTAGLVKEDTNRMADIYLYDQQSRAPELISTSPDGAPGNGASCFPAIAADGSSVAFTSLASNLVPGDTNGLNDVFVFQRAHTPGQSTSMKLFLAMVIK